MNEHTDERGLPACASCGEPARFTIILHGERTPACLRHLNHWRSGFSVGAAALRDAADDVPDWKIPKNADYVRRWLRARADHIEACPLPLGSGRTEADS